MLKRISLLLATFGMLFMISAPVPVLAQTAKESACAGVGAVSGTSGCDAAPGSPNINDTIKQAISILSFIVGVAAVIMIIIGGFKFITAGGDPSKVASARDTILYSVIGLGVAALAQVIVKFVLGKV